MISIHGGSFICFPHPALSFPPAKQQSALFILATLPFFFLWHFLPTAAAKSLQSCPTLCDPIDGSPPGSPVPGILQAGILEWVAISSSVPAYWGVLIEPRVGAEMKVFFPPRGLGMG